MIDEWECLICGKLRPDDKISVHVKPWIINGERRGQHNIKYCNDNPECIREARDYEYKTPQPIEDEPKLSWWKRLWR